MPNKLYKYNENDQNPLNLIPTATFKYGIRYHNIMVNEKIKKSNQKINFSLKEKIIRFLIENKKPYSILQISKELETDYKNTFQAINKINKETISKEKKGSVNLVELKLVPNQDIFLVETKRTSSFLEVNKIFRLLFDDIISLNYPFFIVLVFGSYVKQTWTKNSDIDLCIISDDEAKTKELISKFKLLSISLDIQAFSTKEFESMIKTKEANVGKEIIKNNIILYGTENYYNLISKWMKKE